MVSVRTGFVSITGNFRDNNEDSGLVDPDSRFFIVADGMGGQSAGEKASAMAVELIPEKLSQLVNFESDGVNTVADHIDSAIDHANAEIMALGELDPEKRNMGTTVVLMVKSADGSFLIGGVGDSRVYLLRNDELTQLTTDHSLTQALLDAGTITPEEAEVHKYKNVLYRYLGTKEGGGSVDAKKLQPEPGDRFLLCSDGVTDWDKETKSDEVNAAIKRILQSSEDPQVVAEALVKAAQEGGSRDNITSLVIFAD